VTSVTRILDRVQQGDPKAAEELLPSGRVLYSLPESTGSVWWLAWSPDGMRLAVSRSNGEIAIWNLPEVESVLNRLGRAP